MFDPLGNGAGGATQSIRGRKKKNAAASSAAQSKMFRQQQQHYGQAQHQSQFGQRVGSGSSSFANQMPPPSMHSLRHSTGMGMGLPSEEDSSDFILDDLDRLTPRNIAMARYKRNHELLSLVFDARRIDSLEPPASPYADIDQVALRKELQATENEMEDLRESHAKRIKVLKEDFAKQDAYLHAVKKKGKGLGAGMEGEFGQEIEESVEAQEAEEAWAKGPSKGRIVGVGYVRVSTPEEVRALLPKAPLPVSSAAAIPAAAAATEVAPVTELPSIAAPIGHGEQIVAPLLTAANITGQEQNESGLGDDTAMTGISMEGVEADEDEGEEEDDEEEEEEDDDEEEEEEEEDDEEGAQDGTGLDGDDDADADAEGDEDADADADADAEEEEESMPVKEEQPVENPTVEPIPGSALLDTSMLESEAQLEADSTLEAQNEIDNLEVARVEKERQLVEEVNRQHGVLIQREMTPEDNAIAPEVANELQIEATAALPVDTSPSKDEEMASIVTSEAEPVI